MTGALRVLFLESSKNFGGQERRLLFEARWLLEAGHRIFLACPPDSVLFERAAAAGLTVRPVAMRGSVQPLSIAALVRIVTRSGVELIYTHSGNDSWLGGIAGMICGVPVVRSRELLMRVKHALLYNLFPRRVLTCSDAVKRHLVQSGVREHKIFVQYPPIDVARFGAVHRADKDRVRREFGLDGRFPVVACTGEMRPEKRQVDLVHAMRPLLAEFPSAVLVLTGRDRDSAGIREVAESTGVASHVVFAGEREDIPAILANADVYAFPSSVEPFGMGPVEAMATGIPVVTTNVGGLAEIVSDGVDGLNVPPLSPEAIAHAVIRICREPGLRERLVAAGRIRARHFDAPCAMERLVAHFRAVIGPTAGRRESAGPAGMGV